MADLLSTTQAFQTIIAFAWQDMVRSPDTFPPADTKCPLDTYFFSSPECTSTWSRYVQHFFTLEPDFYKKLCKNNIEGLDMEPYKTFFVPFYSTKLNLININNSVKIEHHQVIRKRSKGESCCTNFWRNHII